jgi:tetratricopeptide (TPR) repeat protein
MVITEGKASSGMTAQNSSQPDKKRIILYFNNNKNDSAQKMRQKLRRNQADKPNLLARSLAYIAGRVFDEQTKLSLFAEALDLDPDNTIILRNYNNAVSKFRNRIISDIREKKYHSYHSLLYILRVSLANKPDLLAKSLAYIAGKIFHQQIKLSLFAEAIKLSPDNVFILTSYGNSLSRNNQPKQALQMLKQALQIKPEDDVIWSIYGNILDHYEQFEEASEKFDKALQINPDNPITLSQYGNALAKNGKYDQAYKKFERSLALNPKNIITLTNYGRALADAGQFEQAFEQFEQALRINRKNFVTLRAYAEALAENERFVQSWEKFERALRLQPENVITLTSYGKVLADSGQLNKSREIFERALQIDPKNIKTLTSYAEALADNDFLEEACELFERALQIDSNDPVTLTSYGTALANVGYFERARQLFERSLQVKPDNHITLFLYAAMLEKAGEYEEAISKMEKIGLNERPQNQANFLRLNLGRLYYLIKQENKANQYFELVIQNSPRDDVARLRAAQNILAVRPYSQEAIEILKKITEESAHYKQAFRMLSLNLTPKAYFEMFKDSTENELKDTEMLNKTMYHKIKNELSLLKSIIYRIIATDQSQNTKLTKIIKNIENMFDEIAKRQEAEKAKITKIATSDYKQLLDTISQTAHDIADFVNNELAVIESRIRRSLYRLSESDKLYTKLRKLLKQVEITQSALNDLKSVNEGLKINHHIFKVEKLFENWQNTRQIEHATILLDIQNGQAEFEGDKPKIRGFVNELVENSLKHNPNKADLAIHIVSKDVDGLPQHVIGSTRRRRRRIPSEKKYLAITASDNGEEGIPPDKKEWIFLPLNTTSTTGSGLGLFIIKKTLEVMNGYILETGTQGAKFELYIPYDN